MLRIVSGGQTGVDRGALDAALAAGLPCGGWCPEGRRAEDGTIPGRYPLRELPGTGYKERTRRNVEDSDGTVILHFGELSGGTALTQDFARRIGRPLLVIDGSRSAPETSLARLNAFLLEHRIETLNVAGPRGSQAPEAHAAAHELIRNLATTVEKDF